MNRAELESLIAAEREYCPDPATAAIATIEMSAFRAGHAAGYAAGQRVGSPTDGLHAAGHTNHPPSGPVNSHIANPDALPPTLCPYRRPEAGFSLECWRERCALWCHDAGYCSLAIPGLLLAFAETDAELDKVRRVNLPKKAAAK